MTWPRVVAACVSGTSILGAAFAEQDTLRGFLRELLVHERSGPTSAPALILFVIAIAAGAFPALPAAFAAFRKLRLEMSALVCIAILGACALGQWMEAAMVAFLYSISGLLEAFVEFRGHSHGPHDHSKPALLPGFVGYYTPVMISIAALTLLLSHSLYRALIVMMDSCPCALLISAPVPTAASALRGGSREEMLRRVIHQNVVLVIGLKVAFLIPTLQGKTTLWMALATDQGAVLLVTLNGLRMLRE